MEGRGGPQPFFAVGAIEDHLLLPRKHIQHQPGFSQPGIGLCRDLYIELPCQRRSPFRRRRRRTARICKRANPVTHKLGGFLIPYGEFSLHQKGIPFPQKGSALTQHTGEYQQFHGAGIILQPHIGHKGIVFRGLCLGGGHYPCQGHPLAVLIGLRTILPVKVGQNGANGDRPILFDQFPIIILPGEFRQVRQRDLRGGRHPVAVSKEVILALYGIAFGFGDDIHGFFRHRKQLGATDPKAVKSAALDKAFHHPLVAVIAEHPLAKVGKGDKRTSRLPLP